MAGFIKVTRDDLKEESESRVGNPRSLMSARGDQDRISQSLVKEQLDLFWQFVAERQRIWTRRYVEMEPPPWTNDPILSSNRFTNVYRELDPGTAYVIAEILNSPADAEDRVFNVMIYRLIGRVETHRYLGVGKAREFDAKSMEARLRRVRAEGHPVFTSAYMVSGYNSMGTRDKISNVCRLFARLANGFDAFFESLVSSDRPVDAHSLIMEQDGFGNFLSYQILVDLTYPNSREGRDGLLPLEMERWASAGPGAKAGIRILDGGRRISELDVMVWLRDKQETEFNRLGLEFPYLVDTDGAPRRLSLPNVQNCLCEFYKYVKIRDGTGRARRRFQAGQESGSHPMARPVSTGVARCT